MSKLEKNIDLHYHDTVVSGIEPKNLRRGGANLAETVYPGFGRENKNGKKLIRRF
jgi:hypothetical protein